MVLLQFNWRRGSKDSRSQGFKDLFSKGFISAYSISPEPLDPRPLVPFGIINPLLKVILIFLYIPIGPASDMHILPYLPD